MRKPRDPFYPSRDPESGLEEDQIRFLDRAVISHGLPSLFYASLRDPMVFEAVVGRPMDRSQWERVMLPGYTLGQARAGTGYPGIFPSRAYSGGGLECLMVHDLNRFEETMVAWYEWDEYELDIMTLTDGRRAQAFVPDLDAIRREYGDFEIEPWSFESWQSHHRDRTVVHARSWMAQRPHDKALIDASFFHRADVPLGREAAG